MPLSAVHVEHTARSSIPPHLQLVLCIAFCDRELYCSELHQFMPCVLCTLPQLLCNILDK